MDKLSEADPHKEDDRVDPGSPTALLLQQQMDPASPTPTVAVTPEPVVRGEQTTLNDKQFQVAYNWVITTVRW